MNIIISKNSGFCFGVRNAIDTSMNTLENSKETNNVHSLGPLIHNNQVVDKLNKLGLSVVDDISEVLEGKIIIRSHGVPLQTYDMARQNNLDIVDCTCPFVNKIQKKVKECHDNKWDIIIVGDKEHPEVIGINGWCNNCAYIINSELDVDSIPKLKRACIVAQTTITNEKFEKISKLVSDKCEEVEIHNTICSATQVRQQSCKDVAEKVDAMIVIGGYHSSNTQKLVDISKKYCKNVYHIETVNELPLDELKHFDSIGITAGASTPVWILEEVYDKMNDISNENNDMLELINENLLTNLQKGDIVNGKVISINNEVAVNINYKSDGIIPKEELSNDADIDPSEVVSLGEEISVLVLSINDGEGNVILSKKRVDNEKSWSDLERNFNNEDIVNVKVTGTIKGGLVANIKGLRGFIPASQVSNTFINDFNTFIGESLDVKIIEFNRKDNNIVLSRKTVESVEIQDEKDKAWTRIKSGQKIKGKVKKIVKFGAFIDIGGIDGLVHISDLSWKHISDPKEVLNIGDEVDVLILELDKNKGRVSLGIKQLLPHPWDDVNNLYKVGDVVEGKVLKLMKFGAFVELSDGIEGLVHISQISDENISHPSECLKVNQSVKVKILNIDTEQRKLELSIREADTSKKEELEKYNDNEDFTIGDILNIKNFNL